ncbi:MAG: hypothetical protein ACUVQW_05945, partial [Candidatus Bathycorpusculaceae bacterium]
MIFTSAFTVDINENVVIADVSVNIKIGMHLIFLSERFIKCFSLVIIQIVNTSNTQNILNFT